MSHEGRILWHKAEKFVEEDLKRDIRKKDKKDKRDEPAAEDIAATQDLARNLKLMRKELRSMSASANEWDKSNRYSTPTTILAEGRWGKGDWRHIKLTLKIIKDDKEWAKLIGDLYHKSLLMSPKTGRNPVSEMRGLDERGRRYDQLQEWRVVLEGEGKIDVWLLWEEARRWSPEEWEETAAYADCASCVDSEVLGCRACPARHSVGRN